MQAVESPQDLGENAYIMGGGRKKTVKKSSAKKTKKPTSKKGGDALSEQLTGLAVPFAFLLAKQGLEALKKDKKKKSATPKKSARRGTMLGGNSDGMFNSFGLGADAGADAGLGDNTSTFAKIQSLMHLPSPMQNNSLETPLSHSGGAKRRKGKKTSTSKKGGACASCGSSVPQLGGASSLRNLEKLRKNIDNFLKKY